MEHVENARGSMESRAYDKAYNEYSIVTDALKGLSGIEENDLYKDEVVPSLEILSKRQGLVDKIKVTREDVKKLEDAEHEYEATEGCGSEHTAAWYSLDYLVKSGYRNCSVNLKHLERELQIYEAMLLGLWQERTQQACV